MTNKKDNPSEDALRRYLEEIAKFDASRDPNDKPTEADWKYFRKVFPELQNRYLETKNNEIIQILTDSEKTQIERYRETREVLDLIGVRLMRCERNTPRNRLIETTIIMLTCGMMVKEDLLGFSLKFQEQVDIPLDKIYP
jgi:hypothetical protein